MASDGPPSFVIVFFSFVGAFMLCMILFSVLKAICRDPPPQTRSRRVAAVRAPSSGAAPSTPGAAREAEVPRAADGGAGAAVLEMLPEFTYSLAAQRKKLNCSVCLMDLRDGERGRFLPSCFHCFHVECIDAWLAARSECPVCRASICPAAPELAV